MGGACIKAAVGLEDDGGGGGGGGIKKHFEGDNHDAKAAWGAVGGAVLAGIGISKLMQSCVTEGDVPEHIHRYSYSSGTMLSCPGTRGGFTGWYWELQLDGKYAPHFWKKHDDSTWLRVDDIKPPRFLVELAQPAVQVVMQDAAAKKKHFAPAPPKKGMSGLLGKLKAGGQNLGGLAKGVGVGLAVGAGAALGAGAVVAVGDVDAGAAADAVSGVGGDAIEAVQGLNLGSIGGSVTGFFKDAADTGKEIVGNVGSLLGGVKDKVVEGAGTIGDTAGDVVDAVGDKVEDAADLVKGLVA